MTGRQYILDDFQIGERMVPADVHELALVIVDIDKERGKIICRILKDAEPLKYQFTPGELEKKPIVIPAGTVSIEKLKNYNVNREL